MEKKLYQCEYVLKGNSLPNIWMSISSRGGLSKWFADDVKKIDENHFRFTWNKQEKDAVIQIFEPNELIRFHWLDEEEDTFFEFKILKDEVTGTVSLSVSDFALPDEIEDELMLWAYNIENLKRNIGV
ncbi:MAG: hypothetical protein LBB53_00040 [Prevotellaceae bacterium]|jgi:uncharacterized protein YndB with AHSA1/START domain|nr:hypothetical protein [Prevotellaceae bacterium]